MCVRVFQGHRPKGSTSSSFLPKTLSTCCMEHDNTANRKLRQRHPGDTTKMILNTHAFLLFLTHMCTCHALLSAWREPLFFSHGAEFLLLLLENSFFGFCLCWYVRSWHSFFFLLDLRSALQNYAAVRSFFFFFLRANRSLR